MNDVAGAFDLARALGLDPIVTIGTTALPRNPIQLSITPVSYRLPPPVLGSESTP